MTNITTLELAVLKAIDDSEYGEYLTDGIWTFSVWDNVDRSIVKNPTSLGGIIASLQKKGFVRVAGSGKDAEIRMTDSGAAAYVVQQGINLVQTNKGLAVRS